MAGIAALDDVSTVVNVLSVALVYSKLSLVLLSILLLPLFYLLLMSLVCVSKVAAAFSAVKVPSAIGVLQHI